MTERLAEGDPAPDFTLPDADGKPVSLADYRGRKVIVYFYPAASTPGCTKQACDFRDNLAELGDAGLDVVGISPDKPAKLARFRDAEGLTFPLLSDPERETLQAWGAFGEKKMYGKTVTGAIRSTFLVDEEGKIEKATPPSVPMLAMVHERAVGLALHDHRHAQSETVDRRAADRGRCGERDVGGGVQAAGHPSWQVRQPSSAHRPTGRRRVAHPAVRRRHRRDNSQAVDRRETRTGRSRERLGFRGSSVDSATGRAALSRCIWTM